MREALEKQQFEVFYQAKVDAQEKKIVGVEALVRWRNNEGLLVSPAEFIPFAEENGLIVAIGKFVLGQACADAKQWHNSGYLVKVSVNVSAVQFETSSFLDLVKDVLGQTGILPSLLELELTEGVLAKDYGQARKMLNALKDLGVDIAIDDFGTGYSSLAYLKQFPIDVLKIDQGFVRNMLTDKSDIAIVTAIVHLAQSLDLELVAEGVEQGGQADVLLKLGCHVMQGYLYCRPMPYRQMSEFLAGKTLV